MNKKKIKNKKAKSMPIDVGFGMPYLHIVDINVGELNPLYFTNQDNFQFQIYMETSPKKYVYGNTKDHLPTLLINLGKNTLKIEYYGLHNGVNIYRNTYLKTKSIKGKFTKASKRDKLQYKAMFNIFLKDTEGCLATNDENYYDDEGDDY